MSVSAFKEPPTTHIVSIFKQDDFVRVDQAWSTGLQWKMSRVAKIVV